jgi:hypothetical protein
MSNPLRRYLLELRENTSVLAPWNTTVSPACGESPAGLPDPHRQTPPWEPHRLTPTQIDTPHHSQCISAQPPPPAEVAVNACKIRHRWSPSRPRRRLRCEDTITIVLVSLECLT